MQEQEPAGYQFRSPEYQLLGKQFFDSVCEKYNLQPEDAKILDDILVDWLGALGNIAKKVDIALQKAGDHPKMPQLLKAMFEINLTFMERSPASQVGKFARKAGLN